MQLIRRTQRQCNLQFTSDAHSNPKPCATQREERAMDMLSWPCSELSVETRANSQTSIQSIESMKSAAGGARPAIPSQWHGSTNPFVRTTEIPCSGEPPQHHFMFTLSMEETIHRSGHCPLSSSSRFENIRPVWRNLIMRASMTWVLLPLLMGLALWPLPLVLFSTEAIGHPIGDLAYHLHGAWWFGGELLQGNWPQSSTITHFPEAPNLWYIDPVGGLFSGVIFRATGPASAWNFSVLSQLVLAAYVGWRMGLDLLDSRVGAGILALTMSCSAPVLGFIHSGLSEFLGLAPVAGLIWASIRSLGWDPLGRPAPPKGPLWMPRASFFVCFSRLLRSRWVPLAHFDSRHGMAFEMPITRLRCSPLRGPHRAHFMGNSIQLDGPQHCRECIQCTWVNPSSSRNRSIPVYHPGPWFTRILSDGNPSLHSLPRMGRHRTRPMDPPAPK